MLTIGSLFSPFRLVRGPSMANMHIVMEVLFGSEKRGVLVLPSLLLYRTDKVQSFQDKINKMHAILGKE